MQGSHIQTQKKGRQKKGARATKILINGVRILLTGGRVWRIQKSRLTDLKRRRKREIEHLTHMDKKSEEGNKSRNCAGRGKVFARVKTFSEGGGENIIRQ